MIKIILNVLLIFFYSFNNYCGCCGTCCVDPKCEMERQYENLKIEDKDILNKGDEGYKEEDYKDIINIADVKLSLKDPAVTSKLNFNSIIKARKYFGVFYDAYISRGFIKEDKKYDDHNENMFNEGYNNLITKLVKDIGDKADFNFEQINDYLVFETEFSLKKTKYEDFSKKILSSANFYKLYYIIGASFEKKSEFKVYFEPALTNSGIYVRKQKEADKYHIVFKSSKPIDNQPIEQLKDLGDDFFHNMKFIFVVFLNTRDFYILLSDEQYKKMEEEYKKKNTPPAS